MKTILTVLITLLATSATTLGQGFGGFGGGGSSSSRGTIAKNSASHQSQTAIPDHSQLVAVPATAVLYFKPESLRLVFAVTADEATSQACAISVKKAIDEIRKGVTEIEVADNNVVEDFIVLDQKFKWELAKVEFANNDDDDDEVAKLIREIPDGFRMQTNLHVLCKDEQQALDVMDVAFKAGVNDIIAFDYWHSKIDNYKKEALKKAVDEAKSKAKILLSVFDKQPALLNVASSAEIRYPESHYVTIQPNLPGTNASVSRAWGNYAKLPALRPKLTYYGGSKMYADLSSTRPAMRPEISVSSTVILTYGSPARDTTLELQRLEISSRADANK